MEAQLSRRVHHRRHSHRNLLVLRSQGESDRIDQESKCSKVIIHTDFPDRHGPRAAKVKGLDGRLEGDPDQLGDPALPCHDVRLRSHYRNSIIYLSGLFVAPCTDSLRLSSLSSSKKIYTLRCKIISSTLCSRLSTNLGYLEPWPSVDEGVCVLVSCPTR